MNRTDFFEIFDLEGYINEIIKEDSRKIESVKNYIDKNGTENMMNFSKAFWENPEVQISGLKKKFEITPNIGYSDILKGFPTNEYIGFLKDYYEDGLSIDNLSQKYKLDNKKINDLMININVKIEDCYCKECLHNEFEVKFNDQLIILECHSCGNIMKYDNTYSLREMEKEKEARDKILDEYYNEMERIKEQLNDIKCPRCQNQLRLSYDIKNYKYKIICDKCNYKSEDIEEAQRAYKIWKHKAAMMIAIKTKEDELIQKALESKSIDNVNFKFEEVITNDDFYGMLDGFMDNSEDLSNDFKDTVRLKKLFKSCTRLERNLLIYIINIAEKEKKDINLEGIAFKHIIYEKPLVAEIIEETGIIVVRKTLKSLMEKFLIAVNEEENYILIPEIIASNLKLIESCNEIQKIEPSLKFITMNRQNYRCYTCGEDGRSLKVAYLTMNKNTLNLDEMVALCDDCYDVYTKNEILIDGLISSFINEEDQYRSIRFLNQYLPDLKGSNEVNSTLEKFEEEFGYENTVKALAITIDGIEKKRVEGTINALLAYTRGILNKSIDKDTGVALYSFLYKKYNLVEWDIDENFIN